MKKLLLGSTTVLLLTFIAGCDLLNRPDVILHTDRGDIDIRLYRDTPKHRANFLKLARKGFYNQTTFYRSVPDIAVLAGDPNSKNKDSIAAGRVGAGGPGYQIDAEILPNHYHKRGALSAFHLQPQVDPLLKSSGSQFFIITGKKQDKFQLNELETRHGEIERQLSYFKAMNQPENRWIIDISNNPKAYMSLQKRNPDSLKLMNKQVQAILKKIGDDQQKQPKFQMPDERLTDYSDIGGAPMLDDQYTVFGEVIEGMEVVDAISHGKTNPMTGQPEKPVVIKSVEVLAAD